MKSWKFEIYYLPSLFSNANNILVNNCVLYLVLRKNHAKVKPQQIFLKDEYILDKSIFKPIRTYGLYTRVTAKTLRLIAHCQSSKTIDDGLDFPLIENQIKRKELQNILSDWQVIPFLDESNEIRDTLCTGSNIFNYFYFLTNLSEFSKFIYMCTYNSFS